jgi:DNA-binding MarR family transcriptional regulator
MARDPDQSRPEDSWADAWRGILFANARVLQVAEPDLIAKVGYPLTWLDVLAQLYDSPDRGLRMQEIQERSLFTRSGITRLIDRMEAAGYVRREPVRGDRRGVRVELTQEGLQAHERGFAAHLPVIEREFGRRLTPDQQRAVAEALAPFWHEPSGQRGD